MLSGLQQGCGTQEDCRQVENRVSKSDKRSSTAKGGRHAWRPKTGVPLACGLKNKGELEPCGLEMTGGGDP